MKQTRGTGLSNSTSERGAAAMNLSRKPSPSIHSNYQMPTKHANNQPHVSHPLPNKLNYSFSENLWQNQMSTVFIFHNQKPSTTRSQYEDKYESKTMNGSVRGNSNEPNSNTNSNVLAPPDLRSSSNNRMLDSVNSQSSKF